MKRISIVVIVIWLLAILSAFAPYAPSDASDTDRRRRTPTPRPSATPVSVGLTAPTLLSPQHGATIHTGNLTFSWTPVPGAARYHIQAAGGTAFDEQSNIIEYWGLTEPSYTFNVTWGFVVYFPRLHWRVQAIDANHVQGPWSEVRTIHLVSP